VNTDNISAFAQALDLITKKAGVAVSTYGPAAFDIAQQYEHTSKLIVFFVVLLALKRYLVCFLPKWL
jgi:hypothetical protein